MTAARPGARQKQLRLAGLAHCLKNNRNAIPLVGTQHGPTWEPLWQTPKKSAAPKTSVLVRRKRKGFHRLRKSVSTLRLSPHYEPGGVCDSALPIALAAVLSAGSRFFTDRQSGV